MSTIGPKAVAALRERLSDSVRLIDAPVKGSLPAASSGELDKGKHLGPLGTGASAKLLVNIVVSSLVPRVRAKPAQPGVTQFALRLAEKDLRLVLEAGGLPNGVVAGARERLAAATRDGLGKTTSAPCSATCSR